ncbi:fused MFS/spermidine synthase [Arachnia propionica]|uniref:spermidine synthase n=1 Tax=Arachnia propionica TaxID=1750 RepID=UPI0028F10081|nr:fused MFS/spermidine synthase [Arachnia propionica]
MPLVPDPQHPGAFRVVFGETSQSWVDPARPDLLLFEYVVQVSLLFEHGLADVGQGERIRVIHIGGAGLSIPRWIAWRRPGTAQIVCEPDAGLTEKVRRKLPLPPRSGIKVRDVDGRSGVAAMPPDYADLVVLDAFDGARVPGELVAAEFLDELARLGRGRRMVICNVTDSSPFGWTRRFAAGLAERWRHLLVGTEPAVWKGRRFGNLLLAASGTRVDVTGLRRDSAKQPCPYRWIEGRELRSWIGGAEPFTDADMQDSPPPSGSKLWFS